MEKKKSGNSAKDGEKISLGRRASLIPDALLRGLGGSGLYAAGTLTGNKALRDQGAEEGFRGAGRSLKEAYTGKKQPGSFVAGFGSPPGGYKKGGKVSSAAKRADGCAVRGKTRA